MAHLIRKRLMPEPSSAASRFSLFALRPQPKGQRRRSHRIRVRARQGTRTLPNYEIAMKFICFLNFLHLLRSCSYSSNQPLSLKLFCSAVSGWSNCKNFQLLQLHSLPDSETESESLSLSLPLITCNFPNNLVCALYS